MNELNNNISKCINTVDIEDLIEKKPGQNICWSVAVRINYSDGHLAVGGHYILNLKIDITSDTFSPERHGFQISKRPSIRTVEFVGSA